MLLVNGMVPAKTRRENVARFQDDASGPQLILVQSQAGKEGISLHDTTGKHQRAAVQFGAANAADDGHAARRPHLPNGSGHRRDHSLPEHGDQLRDGPVATTIAQRASAAENLGSGELARPQRFLHQRGLGGKRELQGWHGRRAGKAERRSRRRRTMP